MNTIDAAFLAKMFLAGAKNLESNKEYINELNVFPVPDGDTGTNMTMTIMSAAREVSALTDPDMKTLSKAISSGSLRGARGNSGVILSQLFRGFTKVIKTEDALTVDILCEAMQRSCETAYKAVMKPKEGTILTVARGAADKALEIADTTDDIVFFVGEIVKEAEEVLKKTPDMLPVLKQAGVVDSGGQGLLEVLKGGYDILLGKNVDLSIDSETEKKEEEPVSAFMYRTAFTVRLSSPLNDKSEKEYTGLLESIGGNVVVKYDHISLHTSLETDDPGIVLSKSIAYGSLHEIKIDNLSEKESSAKVKMPVKEETPLSSDNATAKDAVDENAKTESCDLKEMGFVAVSIGEGMNQIFKDLGADYIIEGGQTMNPSTDDILNAVEKVQAKTVFVLPNNKNIVMAAKQAVELCEDKKLIVLPTKTLPQGITALINFIPEQTAEENEKRMSEEILAVKTGEVTYAVRDTVIDDKEISQGDYMGIGDCGILSVNKERDTAFLDMLKEMVSEESSIISMYYGEGISEKEAEALSKKVNKEFPALEVEVQKGDQPVYYYIASVE